MFLLYVFANSWIWCLVNVAWWGGRGGCRPVVIAGHPFQCYRKASWNSWQHWTWAVLITVMAHVLIKSLFMYPGAVWSLSTAPVCYSDTASPLSLLVRGLVNADSCSSQPQPTWWVAPDMMLNPPTAGATVRIRSIPQGRETSVSNQQQSAPRVMFFQNPPPPQPLMNQPLPFMRPLMRLSHDLSYCFNWCSWCIIPPVTCGEWRHEHHTNYRNSSRFLAHGMKPKNEKVL